MEDAIRKTHSGLISALGDWLASTSAIDRAHGRAFARVQRDRLIADYSGEGVARESAESAVEDAYVFVQAVRDWTGLQRDIA